MGRDHGLHQFRANPGFSSGIPVAVNESSHSEFHGGVCGGDVTKLLSSWPVPFLCQGISLLAPLQCVCGTSTLTGEHMQTMSGIRISCYNFLRSNARRQPASALLYQAKRWRWQPKGKCSTLGAPYSLAPLLPCSSLNLCSIHPTYSTIVFPAQLFCKDSDNTTIPDEHLGSPATYCRKKNAT